MYHLTHTDQGIWIIPSGPDQPKSRLENDSDAGRWIMDMMSHTAWTPDVTLTILHRGSQLPSPPSYDFDRSLSNTSTASPKP